MHINSKNSLSRRQLLQSGVIATAALAGCTDQIPDSQGNSNTSNNLRTFAAEDPGRHSYPPNPSSRDEEILGSKFIEDYFQERYTAYRLQNGLEELFPNATLNSVSRQHSYTMATEGYVDTNGPDDVSPLSQYDTLRVDGTDIYRIVRKTTTVATDSSGGQTNEPIPKSRTNPNEQAVVDALFNDILSDTEDADALTIPKEDAAAAGVGVFLSPVETGTTGTVDVYLTIDICYGF